MEEHARDALSPRQGVVHGGAVEVDGLVKPRFVSCDMSWLSKLELASCCAYTVVQLWLKVKFELDSSPTRLGSFRACTAFNLKWRISYEFGLVSDASEGFWCGFHQPLALDAHDEFSGDERDRSTVTSTSWSTTMGLARPTASGMTWSSC